MKACKTCGSHAINPKDRELGDALDLCDVCYWRARYADCRRKTLEEAADWFEKHDWPTIAEDLLDMAKEG